MGGFLFLLHSFLWDCTVVCYREIGLLINIVLKTWGPQGDILLIWGGRGWYSKPFVKFWIWVYSPFACKWPLKLLNKRPRLKHKNWYKSVICWPILMKFCMQPPIRPSFALANFQLGRKGQKVGRSKGQISKNFQKQFLPNLRLSIMFSCLFSS